MGISTLDPAFAGLMRSQTQALWRVARILAIRAKRLMAIKPEVYNFEGPCGWGNMPSATRRFCFYDTASQTRGQNWLTSFEKYLIPASAGITVEGTYSANPQLRTPASG